MSLSFFVTAFLLCPYMFVLSSPVIFPLSLQSDIQNPARVLRNFSCLFSVLVIVLSYMSNVGSPYNHDTADSRTLKFCRVGTVLISSFLYGWRRCMQVGCTANVTAEHDSSISLALRKAISSHWLMQSFGLWLNSFHRVWQKNRR